MWASDIRAEFQVDESLRWWRWWFDRLKSFITLRKESLNRLWIGFEIAEWTVPRLRVADGSASLFGAHRPNHIIMPLVIAYVPRFLIRKSIGTASSLQNYRQKFHPKLIENYGHDVCMIASFSWNFHRPSQQRRAIFSNHLFRSTFFADSINFHAIRASVSRRAASGFWIRTETQSLDFDPRKPLWTESNPNQRVKQ